VEILRASNGSAAALEYAGRGWPIYPQNPRNRHGYFIGAKDAASSDPTIIRDWVRRYPDMLIAVMTAEVSGIAALDVDVKNRVDGRDTLETAFGIATHPHGPTDHSPNGGFHVLFGWPGHFVKSCRLGPGLEVKGDGAWITLPPGPGRYWDPILTLGTPLQQMLAWMELEAQPNTPTPRMPRRSIAPMSAYGERALDRALRAILDAGAGTQCDILNGTAYGIGQLVGSGEIPGDLALDELLWAAGKMRALDPQRPWRHGECAKLCVAPSSTTSARRDRSSAMDEELGREYEARRQSWRSNGGASEPRFRLQGFDEIRVGRERRYLVKDILPRNGLVVAWGPPKCGKTFWVLDLVMHVALGWEYRGIAFTKAASFTSPARASTV
jgi:hypothetical protein